MADDYSATDDPLTDEEWAAFKDGAGIDRPAEPTYRLYGYVCPECKTWAEDMTPHCFNEHADDPVATLPFYVVKEK